MAASRFVDNGDFDPRITSIPSVVEKGDYSQSLFRGYIVQDKPVNGVRYRCNFLYNPSVVSVSHTINPNVVANSDAVNPYDVTAGDLLLPLQQTLQFSLLFDRTYELWDPSKLDGDSRDGVTSYGVGWDVLSLYKITGVASPINVDTAKSADSGVVQASSFSKGDVKNEATGPMLYVPVYVVFGHNLDYYGVIQSLDVQYTHWAWSMTPSRAQVGITVQLLPRNGANSKTAPAPTSIVPKYNNPSILNPANNGKGGR